MKKKDVDFKEVSFYSCDNCKHCYHTENINENCQRIFKCKKVEDMELTRETVDLYTCSRYER